ncbi:flavodoxin family protein [Rhodosalinus sediminis]|uniref:Flavodoxin family protein n=1 Tax=Rhodosalinus sediminis TaxID=1940533 RepID=A0A3D9BUX2_9RHOB|nr:NAD(P)H-dependent oxidoreductase [Rhodosalinus sediminis]REC57299.1 flavodoxin family protein [Rhodosalinus sediminis]
MRALVVHCHPRQGSFTAAVRDTVIGRLHAAGAEVRLIDLYAEAFDPVLGPGEHAGYARVPENRAGVEAHVAHLEWCDTLIFVYPTWWYGLPAMLKGWLDRVLLPGSAFVLPEGEGETIRPGLTHVRRLAVFTTCGASRWLTALIGAPGKRTILRGVRALCARGCRTAFAAHYLMDSSTAESRARHLARVARRVDRMTGGAARGAEARAA